jgi:hypothetical protein
MSLEQIRKIANEMTPDEALAALALTVRELLSVLGEEARIKFVMNLIGEAGTDKVASLVHL